MEREMIRNLAVVISGGALGFALAASVGPLGANEASASAAGVASATLLTPSDPPIIRDSSAQAAPAYGLPPPIVDDAVQAAPSRGNDPPIIDDAARAASSRGLEPPIIDD
jgi:hypothetical protein